MQNTELSRRGLLRVLGAGAATAGTVSLGALPARGTAAPTAAALPSAAPDDAYWKSVERLFTIDKDILFMNVGTVGSPPREVLDVVDSTHRAVARGAVSAYSNFLDVRTAAAPGFGCDPDELVFSHNTSDGMSKVLGGLGLRAGDEVLTTNHEHSGGLVPLALLRDRYGVVVRQVELPVGDDQTAEDYVELFRAGITGRTKVLMFSAPTYKTGTMLPIRMLAELAQEHGLTTVVDGAHVPGMMAYDFHQLGVDFLAGSAAKWQCGPGGTGVLYIRNKVLSQYNPNPLPDFWPIVSSSYPQTGRPTRTTGPVATSDIGTHLQSVGNGSLAVMAGVQKACAIWDGIGRKKIEDHIVGLATTLKRNIAERWGAAALYAPLTDARLRCALTSFNPFRNPAEVYDKAKSDAFVARLRSEYGIVVRNSDPAIKGQTARPYPLRISTHLFHQAEDVERVTDAMWKISVATA